MMLLSLVRVFSARRNQTFSKSGTLVRFQMADTKLQLRLLLPVLREWLFPPRSGFSLPWRRSFRLYSLGEVLAELPPQ